MYNLENAPSVLEERSKSRLVNETISILEGKFGLPVRVVGAKSCSVTSGRATISVAMSDLFINGKLLEGIAYIEAHHKGVLLPEWELDKVYLDVFRTGGNGKSVERISVWSAATSSPFTAQVPELSALRVAKKVEPERSF